MASLAYSSNWLGIAVTLILFFSLTFSPSISGSSVFSRRSEDMKQKKPVLGSRPPQCANRCLSCRPCMAALVTPPHHKTDFRVASPKGDESYYLLSWRCKCGDKYFQP